MGDTSQVLTGIAMGTRGGVVRVWFFGWARLACAYAAASARQGD